VTFVAPTIEARTRTLRVKAELANGDGRLRPGTFAHVDLGVARRDGVVMVPEEAVLQRADGQVVFRVVDGDRVERRVIRTGLHREGRIEVVEGLGAGDTVVTRGHVALVDGARIRVHAADEEERGDAAPIARSALQGQGS
jgi:RND family efflux transporter MFP subunit